MYRYYCAQNISFRSTEVLFSAKKTTYKQKQNERELARRGQARLEEARERLVARAAASGEPRLVTTKAMVRKEMSKKAVEIMQAKASRTSMAAI